VIAGIAARREQCGRHEHEKRNSQATHEILTYDEYRMQQNCPQSVCGDVRRR
jgi:hypothetical protein